jgi:hypothetical protein
MLALPCPLARKQGSRERLCCSLCGQLVQDELADLLGTTDPASLDPGHARVGLDDRIVGAKTGSGSDLTESRDRNVDESGIGDSKVVVSEAKPRSNAWTKVLHNDVRGESKPANEVATLILTQIDGDRPLAPVQDMEHPREAVTATPYVSLDIASTDALDIDDLRSLVGEQRSRHRSRYDRRQIEDSNVTERPCQRLSYALRHNAYISHSPR